MRACCHLQPTLCACTPAAIHAAAAGAQGLLLPQLAMQSGPRHAHGLLREPRCARPQQMLRGGSKLCPAPHLQCTARPPAAAGKIIWARHNEVQTVNLKSLGDAEEVRLLGAFMSSCCGWHKLG